MLPGLVTAGLVAGELTAAESAAAELAAVAAERDVPMLRAAAMHAAGQVQLAVGDAQSASDALRQALGAWQALRAPYDAALTRVELARALRALGDAASADVELEAARWVLEQLGARPDLARVTALLGRARVPEVPGGLTPRECEVLRLVATGRTNRQLAHELFLSEKTVARHLANIFAKLGVSSRAAATSYAWEHGLV
jgi:DNA-binding CsgD family transcriptional regulator